MPSLIRLDFLNNAELMARFCDELAKRVEVSQMDERNTDLNSQDNWADRVKNGEKLPDDRLTQEALVLLGQDLKLNPDEIDWLKKRWLESEQDEKIISAYGPQSQEAIFVRRLPRCVDDCLEMVKAAELNEADKKLFEEAVEDLINYNSRHFTDGVSDTHHFGLHDFLYIKINDLLDITRKCVNSDNKDMVKMLFEEIRDHLHQLADTAKDLAKSRER